MSRAPHDSVFVLTEEQFEDFLYNMRHPKPLTPTMLRGIALLHELSKKRVDPGAIEYDSWRDNFPKRYKIAGRRAPSTRTAKQTISTKEKS